MDSLSEFLRLLLGTVIYRPYVYGFLACFLVFAIYQIGTKRTIALTVMSWCLAFAAEYSSTRNGFPFGPYFYIDDTRTRELWISNVPFWDSLSFTFLSYFSYILAAGLLSKGHDLVKSDWPGFKRWYTPILGGFLMMLLDVVIDPVTLQGSKWFLGQIYGYPYEGFYFGVTLENFLGWWFVGAVTQTAFQLFLLKPARETMTKLFLPGVACVFAGVFVFNFFVTVWIKDFTLAKASALVIVVTMGCVIWRLRGVMNQETV